MEVSVYLGKRSSRKIRAREIVSQIRFDFESMPIRIYRLNRVSSENRKNGWDDADQRVSYFPISHVFHDEISCDIHAIPL